MLRSRSHPSGALTTDLPPGRGHGPHGQSRAVLQLRSLLTYRSRSTGTWTEHDARGQQRRQGAAAQDPILTADACELSARRCTHLRRGIWYPLQTHLLLFSPPSQPFVAIAGGKGQAVKAKLLLEPLKMQTNSSDMLRSLLGGERAIKR